MHLKLPNWRLFALAAITALALTACGSATDENTGGGGTPSTPTNLSLIHI